MQDMRAQTPATCGLTNKNEKAIPEPRPLKTRGLTQLPPGGPGPLPFPALKGNLPGHPKTLFIGQVDDLPDLYVAKTEVQCVIGANVGREPVLAINLLAIGYELG